MATPQRPVWSEGMFLSPQHLQSLDRYHEGLLQERLTAIAPNAWGVAALEIDAAALGTGQLRVVRFRGTLPGGLMLTCDESEGSAPPPRPVAEHLPPQARSVDVWLAVPREREGIPTFAEAGGETGPARSRFAVTARPVPDATQPGANASVAFARPNPVILLGAEPREDHDAIKIAEIGRGPSGQLALADAYVPPITRVGASPWLAGALRSLLARLHAKQRELAEARGVRDPSGAASATEVARLLQLYALNGAIPHLAFLADAGDAPPLDAYLALTRLAGQLATFSGDPDVSGLPRYAHADLRATFDPIVARLGAYLGGMALEQFTRVPLEARGPLQVARLEDEKLLRVQLVLSVRTDLPEAQVAEQLPRLCKVASLADVQALVQAAAPGVPLVALRRPPPELPARAGVIYFAVSPAPNDRLWKGVASDRSLAFYLPPPFDPSRTKVELVALSVPAAG